MRRDSNWRRLFRARPASGSFRRQSAAGLLEVILGIASSVPTRYPACAVTLLELPALPPSLLVERESTWLAVTRAVDDALAGDAKEVWIAVRYEFGLAVVEVCNGAIGGRRELRLPIVVVSTALR